MTRKLKYQDAIREGFEYLLGNHKRVFAIGQGLWSPWYVGNTMIDLDKKFGRSRVVDTPVSENACTGIAIGASLCGYRPIVIHPRMDFMILATDTIVNQAAKWHHMLGGQSSPAVTVRGIINRGGEQGAQHSQALHSWYAHIPGLRVVMPATVQDARDLLIAAVLCDDPTVYIDDRWLYDREEVVGEVDLTPLTARGPAVLREGTDVTLVGSSYATHICEQAAEELATEGISAEVVDLRVLNPLDRAPIVASVGKTGRLVAVDSGWKMAGVAGEIIASACEAIEPMRLKAPPIRLCLTEAPAPCSKVLEQIYYTTALDIISAVKQMMASCSGERNIQRSHVGS